MKCQLWSRTGEGARAYQRQGVQSLRIARRLQHHAQLVDLGVLLWRGVPWVAALLVGGGGWVVVVVVLGIQLQVGVFVFGGHGEKQRAADPRVEAWW